MTGLLSGSLVAIVVAAVTLVVGWLTASETVIWLSAGSSALAGVLLALSYHRALRLARSIQSGRNDAS